MKILTLYMLLIVGLLLVVPVQGHCAVALDNSSSQLDLATSSLTWSHTVNSNSNGILIVGVSYSPQSVSVGSVTYNGLPLAPAGTIADAIDARVEVWYRVAPPTGAHNVVVTMNGGNAGAIVGGAASFVGVDQAAPFYGPFASASFFGLLGLVPQISVPTKSTEQMVVGVMALEGVNVLSAAVQGTGLWGQLALLAVPLQGSGSYAQGVNNGNVTLSWLGVSLLSSYGIGAVVLNPAYQPDAMIKNNGEADAAYLTPNLYETIASAQAKAQSVVNGTAAAYPIRITNNGSSTDDIVITGSASGSNFTVQYLDDTSTDRTAAVTGGGYTIVGLASLDSRVWTLNVTPGATVVGGSSYPVNITASSQGAISLGLSRVDQVRATTSSISPVLTIVKVADKASYKPGEDITYTATATNGPSLSSASSVVVTDPIPANTGFKVGGTSFNAGTSTLTASYTYSNNSGTTYAYTPVSGGCSAPAGYDYCVTNVKWTMAGTMPTNTSFSVGLVVRVK